jgi:hypothetical protein
MKNLSINTKHAALKSGFAPIYTNHELLVSMPNAFICRNKQLPATEAPGNVNV